MLFLNYLRSHWSGSQGLMWSFWVNLVGLRLVIMVAQSRVFATWTPEAAPLGFSLIMLLVFAHLTVFIWQTVGVLRASDQHVRELGSITSTWGAQLGILIAFIFVLSDVWGARLMTRPAKDTVSFSDQMDRARAENYSLKLSDDKKVLMLSGEITLGVTKTVTALLAANPQVDTLSLNSSGGNIFEARGLAKLSRDSRLNTLAVDVCSSACTIAFIGGVSRKIAPGARLGFHQYRVEASYELPFANPAAEQERDREIYRKNGVENWFLELMFQEKSNDIWYPTSAELLRAGILVSN